MQELIRVRCRLDGYGFFVLSRDAQYRIHAIEPVQAEYRADRPSAADNDLVAELKAHLLARAPSPSHVLSGTAFQRDVWRTVQKVPPGWQATYGEVASAMGVEGAHRAVAAALSENRLALLVPCHRIVRADGKPTNFRFGLPARERWLEVDAMHSRRKKTGKPSFNE